MIDDDAAVIEGSLVVPKGAKFAIVASRFNHFIVDRLVEGAIDALVRHGARRRERHDRARARRVGDPARSRRARSRSARGKVDAIIALGAVIRGSTPHFDYVAGEVAKGVATVVARRPASRSSFGVLTTDTIEQADRARRHQGRQQGLGRGGQRDRDGLARRARSTARGPLSRRSTGAAHGRASFRPRSGAADALPARGLRRVAPTQTVELFWRSFDRTPIPRAARTPTASCAASPTARDELDRRITAASAQLAPRAHGARRSQRPPPRHVGARCTAPTCRARSSSTRPSSSRSRSAPTSRAPSSTACSTASPTRSGAKTSRGPERFRSKLGAWSSASSPPSCGGSTSASVELCACSIWSDERPVRGFAGLLDWRLGGRISRLLKSGFLRGDVGEVLLVPGKPHLPFDKVLVVGLGSAERFRRDRVPRGHPSHRVARSRACAIRKAVVELPGRACGAIEPEPAHHSGARLRRRVARARHVVAGRAARRPEAHRGPRGRRAPPRPDGVRSFAEPSDARSEPVWRGADPARRGDARPSRATQRAEGSRSSASSDRRQASSAARSCSRAGSSRRATSTRPGRRW